MISDQAIQLVEYNQWPNRRILVKASKLSHQQLSAETHLSNVTVFATLVHLLDAQWYWRVGIQSGNLPSQKLSTSDFENLSALRSRWKLEDQLLIEFVKTLSTNDLIQAVTYKWPRAKPRSRPLWQILMHIINHGTHHRSEIGQHLFTMGHSPGDMDFIKFVATREI